MSRRFNRIRLTTAGHYATLKLEACEKFADGFPNKSIQYFYSNWSFVLQASFDVARFHNGRSMHADLFVLFRLLHITADGGNFDGIRLADTSLVHTFFSFSFLPLSLPENYCLSNENLLKFHLPAYRVVHGKLHTKSVLPFASEAGMEFKGNSIV